MPVPDPRRDPLTRYIILFLATVFSTTAAGALHYLSFYQGFADGLNPFTWGELMVRGLCYSVPILAILGCLELALLLRRVDPKHGAYLPALADCAVSARAVAL